MNDLINIIRNNFMTVSSAILATMLCLPVSVAGAQVILFVNAAAPPGGDGSSWDEAIDDLQRALTVAREPGSIVDEVWVAAGTYWPWSRCSALPQVSPAGYASFEIVPGVDIYGGFAGFETDPSQRNLTKNVTVLSGILSEQPATNCCASHGNPGCDCEPCVTLVCALDSSCCEISWDAACAALASSLCTATCSAWGYYSTFIVKAIGGSEPTVLDGLVISGGRYAIQAEHGSIELRHCSIPGEFGEFRNQLVLNNSTFIAHHCRFDGGHGSRLVAQNSTLALSDCHFGVVISAMTSTPVQISDSSFFMERSQIRAIQVMSPHNGGSGGGISAIDSTVHLRDVVMEGLRVYGSGGAILSWSSHLNIENCSFRNNAAHNFFTYGGGGAIRFFGAGSMHVQDSEFIANRAGMENPETWSAMTRGGAINAQLGNGTLIFQRCTFNGNESPGRGGAILAVMGDAALTMSSCTFGHNRVLRPGEFGGAGYFGVGTIASMSDCTFHENEAWGGGAVGCEEQSTVQFDRCEFVRNVATHGGAALVWVSSPAIFANCGFFANRADLGGAMTAWYGAEPKVINCTFAGNTAERGGAILARDFPYGFTGQPAAIVHIRNSILFGNIDITGVPANGQIVLMENASAHVRSSCVDTGGGLPWPGPGNISNNPLFIDPIGPDGVPGTGDEDYRLALQSPCIDAGENNAAIPYGPLDLDQLPRFVDVAAMPDTGCGAAPLVDLGAYEVQAIPPGKGLPPRLGDLNGDGAIGPVDLGILLGQWGMAADCLIADLNGDNVVGPVDLGILLGNWNM